MHAFPGWNFVIFVESISPEYSIISSVLLRRSSPSFVFLWFLLLLGQGALSANELSHEALFGPNTEYPYFEAIGLPTEVETDDLFNLDLARFLAEASLLAYVEEEAFIAEALKKAGFKETRFFAHEGTFAYLAQNDSAIVLSFRGSETANKADYTTDAKIVQTPFFDYGTAHFGFIEAFEWVRSAIDDAIEELLAERERPIWVTGHSLGAALATLYGIHRYEVVSAIYPIGSPRVGGIQFAKNTENLVNIFRIVNDNDIIPRLPAPPFYRHVGSTYFLTSTGELLENPSFTRKWESQRKGHAALIKKLYEDHWQKGDFRAVPTDYVVDHSPRLYVEALASLTDKTVFLNEPDGPKPSD